MLYGTDVKVILGISSLPVPTVMPNQAAPTIVADVIGVLAIGGSIGFFDMQ